MRVLLVIVLLLGACVAAFAVGLRMVPGPLPPFTSGEPELETVPLPADLPAPVDRWYRELYGERVPVIPSAVISGRATLRLMGLTFNGRFRFIHDAGAGYRHYLDATLFGLPLMRVNEWFLGGRARLELPMERRNRRRCQMDHGNVHRHQAGQRLFAEVRGAGFAQVPARDTNGDVAAIGNHQASVLDSQCRIASGEDAVAHVEIEAGILERVFRIARGARQGRLERSRHFDRRSVVGKDGPHVAPGQRRRRPAPRPPG